MAKPTTRISITTEPTLKQFDLAIDRFADQLGDFKPMFHSMDTWFKREMVSQFASEGAYSGPKWKPLTEAYRKWKQENYPGRTIGHLTGALMSSMTGGGGYHAEIGTHQASFGMSDTSLAKPYGGYFAKLRPVIRFRHDAEKRLVKLIQQDIVAYVRQDFGGPYMPKAISGRTTLNSPVWGGG